jgi:hypothetical protein
VPVTTSSESQDILGFHGNTDVIITLNPVISLGMDPANVMTTIRVTTFMSNYTNKLISSCIEARSMRTI